MLPLSPLAVTVDVVRLGSRRRAAAEFQGLVMLVVVSGLTTATLVMLATLVRTI